MPSEPATSVNLVLPKSVPSDLPQLGYLELSKLRLDEANVRKTYDDIDTLAETIRRQGILQPLLVKPVGDGTFIVIAGNRRFMAAQKLGLDSVPVHISDVADDDKVAVQLIENVQRSDLSAIEIAQSPRQLIEHESPGKDRLERVAARVGKNAHWINRHVALLKLDQRVVEAIERNRLGISQAAEVSRLARANEISRALELANAMKNGQVKRAEARAQQEQAAPDAPRVFERKGDGFAVRITFTTIHEAREATFRADLDKLIAAYGGVQ